MTATAGQFIALHPKFMGSKGQFQDDVEDDRNVLTCKKAREKSFQFASQEACDKELQGSGAWPITGR